MKNVLIYGIVLLVLIGVVSAGENETELYVGVTTDGDLNAVIVENAEGSIDNTIYCNGATCNTNINGGTITPSEEQIFNYNTYGPNYITKHGNSFSINRLFEQMARGAEDYYIGDSRRTSSDVWNMWGLLDAMFVSHRESRAVFNNVDYLARQMDNLQARVNIMERMFNLENNTDYQKEVADQTIINYANRTGDYTCFEDGQCVIVHLVN